MELQNKELCGKNIYFVKKTNRFSMYHNDKKIGEIQTNDEGSVIGLRAYNKKYVKNLIFYIDVHKNLLIEDIKGLPCEYKYINLIKERLFPDVLLHYAILSNSLSLAKYAIDREANLTKETFISAAINSSKITYIHVRHKIDFIEEAMEAAFKHKNYESIKILAKKTNNLEKYINLCNEEEKYQVIKKELIKILVKRNADKY